MNPGLGVAVVTGGAGILGVAITERLIESGLHVVVADRDQGRLGELVDASNGAVRGFAVDITDRAAVEDMQATVEAELGRVTVLVNNAAGKSSNFFEPFESFDLDEWREVMDANVTSAVVCSQVFGGRMRSIGAGTVVNVLSIYGIVAPDQRIYEGSHYLGRSINTPAVYSASKAALWGLTRYLATYWGGDGVRVNAVTPGGVFSGQNDTFVERYSERVPLGRMAEPHEVADAIAFLTSDQAKYINGHNLVVDGGLTVW